MAVVDEASFTRAAEKLFVTQSALSQQIQALEQSVGAVLLDRSKRGVRLTAAGEALHRHARRVVAELEAALVAIREIDGLQRGELRVGVVQTVNEYLMPALMAAFSARHPQVKLSIDELSSDAIETGLEAGEVQIGLGFAPPTSPLIAAEPLFEERLALIVRDDHPLAQHRVVPVGALDDLPMILLSNTFCTRRLWEENARLASAQPRVVMEVNTVSSILAVVARTGLATVLPRQTCTDQSPEPLVTLDLQSPAPSRQVALLWNRARYLCSASRAFIEAARAVTSAINAPSAATA
jgi:LysR family cyn operon transcriptional activator